tara:strand:- start:168 stop:581 length:414 start_codon:yes stop_codon:yes gene_type:complete
MKKKKILIVSSTYYKNFSDSLEDSAIQVVNQWSKKWKEIKYHKTYAPGIFEIPYIISKNIKKYDGFIALGCVIKGETPHFEFISQATTNAIMQLSIDHKKPIGNGIITCLNKEQASARVVKKGREAAEAALILFDIS